MRVREATEADLPAVMNVLDGAALEIDVATVRGGIERDGTLVAVSGDGETTSDRVLGALVLDGDRVAAVAVRRRRRGQGIGTRLVEAALDRRDRLIAEFDADVRPFYERLGFDVEPLDNEADRFRGTR
ncbi:GNAT family N-acetyltransferase [Haloarcula taiwanensis]|uniref:GNAT family N-acetyltransferase n=1 Tax=Haloarcula taiwanensis TaxID=1932004 RepID=A0A2H5A1X5_9EURY|nr:MULTISPECIES: GNAT family N-acetyltransferase [Haloarcula]AUG48680.1 GNAT family N-acetyltransferase [Haloarcula taiwanensis]RLM40012.1 N-acetyltransferase [Haloarcula sp. Atlit-120R]